MWRRLYLLLLLVRVYFALSPSYIHPDEHFQGLEVIAGDIFGWETTRTWEFNSAKPIRSVFPLWLAYGLPMQLLYLITGDDAPSPKLVYYTLRILFLVASFVFEDWAMQELVTSPRHRQTALLLVASSYVTWAHQSHTFSNSLETIAVAWALVLIQRIYKSKDSALLASALLGCVSVFGVFNRITFPGFIFLPVLRLVPHYMKHPLGFIVIGSFAFLIAFIGIYLDTAFYHPPTILRPSFLSLDVSSKVITPLNNLIYNSNTSNLALHGLHPRYTHFLINLPQLLGPATLTALVSSRFTLPMLSAISGTVVLSVFQHQEARFLMPCVPLILSSMQLPRARGMRNIWITVWIIFNVALGLLMGVYHQGGVVPVQNYIAEHLGNATSVVWWKTYSPPTWLLGEMNERCSTEDLMGAKRSVVDEKLEQEKGVCGVELKGSGSKETYLVAPLAMNVEKDVDGGKQLYKLQKVWVYRSHLGFDDLDFDFGKDGVFGAVIKVWDSRGLGIWRVVDESCNLKT